MLFTLQIELCYDRKVEQNQRAGVNLSKNLHSDAENGKGYSKY